MTPTSRLLYTIGNLYTGYPYGVEAERQFGTIDVYGPFSSESEADDFARQLVEGCDPAGSPYRVAKVVRIETPATATPIERSAA